MIVAHYRPYLIKYDISRVTVPCLCCLCLFTDDRESGSEEDCESDTNAELPSPSVQVQQRRVVSYIALLCLQVFRCLYSLFWFWKTKGFVLSFAKILELC